MCRVGREMKVNGRRNKGGHAAWILGTSAWQFLQRVSALSRRARCNRMHTNMHDRAPVPNTGSARGGTRAKHLEGRESRARVAGREQCAPRPPEPQATTRIEQLNTQEMVAYKPTNICVAASRTAVWYHLRLVYCLLYIPCHTLPSNLTNKMFMPVLKII